MTLLSGSTPVRWRKLATDGADLPQNQQVAVGAEQIVAVGETYDFEFQPEQAGELHLEVFRPHGRLRTTLQVDVQ